MMNSNRRQFIKRAGAGVAGLGFAGLGAAGLGTAGLGLLPEFGQASQLWSPEGVSSFPRASPESQGVSSPAIRAFVAAANASGISWHSFMLVRHGRVVAEGWWKPFESRWVHSLYSLSKSFTSTAIGLLVKEGMLDIQAPVISFFPVETPANPPDNLRKMTVRSLLTMNTGHDEDTMPKMRASEDPWVRTYLAQPVPFAPGSHFLYNTGNTYMLGAILHNVTGLTLEQYLGPRLFQPLGISGYDWEVSPQGLNTAGYGLRVKTEDIAKLGQLYLQKGNWKGSAILPESWVLAATSVQTTSQAGNGDWSQGYGYQFWRCTHDFYRGDGAYGQFCIVMPELDAVLAVTSQSADMQQSLNLIWDHLPGAMQASPLPENRAEQVSLKTELAGLTLPVVKGSVSSPLASKYHQRVWTLAGNEFGAQTLQFEFSVKGCRLTVVAGDREDTLRFGWENWLVSADRGSYLFKTGDLLPMPSYMAGTATWSDDHTLQLNTRFVEAIFGDSITCVFEGGKLNVSFLNSVAAADKKRPEARKGLTGVLAAG